MELKFSDREMLLFTMMFNLTGRWVEGWIAVQEGTSSKAEAFDTFDATARDFGLFLAQVAISSPGFSEKMQEIGDNAENYVDTMFPKE